MHSGCLSVRQRKQHAVDAADGVRRIELGEPELLQPFRCIHIPRFPRFPRFSSLGNLLLNDVLRIWEQQVARAEQLSEFFRKVHYAHGLYMLETQKNGGTALLGVSRTRWAGVVDVLQSVVDNRQSIENTLGQLRRERSKSKSVSWNNVDVS